ELESAPVRRSLARADADDAARHATFHMARRHKGLHKELNLKVGDKAYLQLGKGYQLKGIPKSKLGDQRVGPFTVLEKVGSLAYRLDLPTEWRIHPVVSVAQLEP